MSLGPSTRTSSREARSSAALAIFSMSKMARGVSIIAQSPRLIRRAGGDDVGGRLQHIVAAELTLGMTMPSGPSGATAAISALYHGAAGVDAHDDLPRAIAAGRPPRRRPARAPSPWRIPRPRPRARTSARRRRASCPSPALARSIRAWPARCALVVKSFEAPASNLRLALDPARDLHNNPRVGHRRAKVNLPR